MAFARTLAIAATVLAATVASAQEPAPNPVRLPDTPQILDTATGPIRVVPIKGLEYPWGLTFLPNGDMLVTEQSKNTLRLIRGGVLDPTPITGLPPVYGSSRRDSGNVDVTLHPRFSENQVVYAAYWKPKPETEGVRTATVVRARLDGHRLTDVEEVFESVSWTDGPSSVRGIFGSDGKLYVSIGAPGFADILGETG